MYSSLRPEIRGSQRVLRSIQYPSSRITHRTVRSFSSYIRLQAQPGSNGDQGKPQDTNDKNTSSPITHKIHEIVKSFGNRQHEPLRDGDAKSSFPAQLPDLDFAEIARRGEEEKRQIDEALENGEIPKGYRVVDSLKDVPRELQSFTQFGHGLTLPFLLCEDKSKLVRVLPLPESFRSTKKSEDESIRTTREEETDQAKTVDSPAPQNDLDTHFYGSSKSRRKRARTSKSAQISQDNTPSWLLDHNLKFTRLPGTMQSFRPQVWSAVLQTDKMSTQEYKPLSEAEFRMKDVEEPKEQAYGAGDEGLPGSNNDVPASQADTKSSTLPPKELANSRYFIDFAQAQELNETFNGRLNTSRDSTSSKYPGPSAANHLAIYHTAKDADLLLDALVSDLCMTWNADLLRLDVQDISALIAQADVDPEVADRGGKASFGVLQNVYGASPQSTDTMSSQGADFLGGQFEDEMGDDDDAMNSRDSVDIPVASFVALPGAGMPKGFLDGFRKKIFGSGGPLSQMLSTDMSDDKSGLFWRAIDSLLSSANRRKRVTYSRQFELDEPAEEDRDENEVLKKRINERPLIIHVSNIDALQADSLLPRFVEELIHAADTSTKNGRRIMVVATACSSDAQNHSNSRTFQLVQDHKMAFTSATNIVLTPVFPSQEARLALLEDRKRRIATINARHLWSVLQSRGVLLRGLEAGFWTRDFSSEMGEKDYEALRKSYWSYFQVQRLATLLNADHYGQSQTPIHDALSVIETSDLSKKDWFRRNQPDVVREELNEAEQIEQKKMTQVRAKASRHEKKLLSGVIEPGKINTTFKDIHIPVETIDALQTLTSLSLLRPDAFRYGVLKSDRIPGLLLYGPPGTGKTLAAKAVAKESGATMLEVSAADLNDMYVGEGEKNIQALFSLAKKLSPCVVFLDEADAMFSARSAQGRRVSHRELLNQFLKEWDGMSNDSGSAFIMVATNRPMDLDDAVLRRLPRRILVDLPTEQDRLEILKIHLRHEHLADDVNIPEIAKKTPFYSGSDLKNVAVAAALNAVREEHEAAKKYRQENPDGEPHQYPERRTLTKVHFDKALEEISASISEDMSSLKDIKKFDEQYGDKRGKKKKSPKWGFRSAAEAERKLDTVKVRS